MTVRSGQDGAVTTIILHRPPVRNAVDGPTARALADAFRAFDADETARVAVLWGDGGTFCSGADLKAIAAGEKANALDADGNGPMGPTRLRLTKPAIAAISGPVSPARRLNSRAGGRPGWASPRRAPRR